MKRLVKSPFLIIILSVLIVHSCVPYKKLRYYESIDPARDQFTTLKSPKVIQPFDKLYIRVYSIDEKAIRAFNSSDNNSYLNENLLSYQVNDSGSLTFPFVGSVKVSGLTLEEAGKKLKRELNQFISNTDVTVRYVDNRVSVLGEVNRQGDYNYYQDKLTLFQAIALAGGLTRYGNMSRVTIVRTVDGKVNYINANLHDKKLVERDYYYTMPNDIIIVEPLKAVSWSYQNVTYTTLLSTITTAIAVLISINSLK